MLLTRDPREASPREGAGLGVEVGLYFPFADGPGGPSAEAGRDAPAFVASASEEFFSEDRAAFLTAREAALSLLPLPHVFEAFVFGPSGSWVEYCFQTVARRPDGEFEVRWRNREGGGNWVVTL